MIPKCFKRLHDYEDTKVFLNAYMTTRIPKCVKRLHDYEDIKVFLYTYMITRINLRVDPQVTGDNWGVIE
jgi:hypothetical protein